MTDPTTPSPVDPAALPPLPSMPGLDGAEDVTLGLRLRARVMEVLAAEGLATAVDEQGDIVVTAGDQTVFVSVITTVPPFLRVFGSWLLDDDGYDELLYLRAANAVTGAINLVKVTVHGDALVVAADLLLSLAGAELDDGALAALVGSTVDAILGTAQTWHSTVDELRQHV